jgi:hypothetical protein
MPTPGIPGVKLVVDLLHGRLTRKTPSADHASSVDAECGRSAVLKVRTMLYGASATASYVGRNSHRIVSPRGLTDVPVVTHRMTGRPAGSPRRSTLVQMARGGSHRNRSTRDTRRARLVHAAVYLARSDGQAKRVDRST